MNKVTNDDNKNKTNVQLGTKLDPITNFPTALKTVSICVNINTVFQYFFVENLLGYCLKNGRSFAGSKNFITI